MSIPLTCPYKYDKNKAVQIQANRSIKILQGGRSSKNVLTFAFVEISFKLNIFF